MKNKGKLPKQEQRELEQAEVFDAAVQEARKTIAEAKKARESIRQFEETKKREIVEEIQRARQLAVRAAEDFTGHVEAMKSAEKTAKSIQTVLGVMRGHAASLRQTILKNIEDRNHKAAAENIKALFAFYDVNLNRRFDEARLFSETILKLLQTIRSRSTAKLLRQTKN